MKKQITFLLTIFVSCLPILAQDTVKTLIITEIGGPTYYAEFTNVGQETIDLSRFTYQVNNSNVTWVFDGPNTHPSDDNGPGWWGGPVRLAGDYSYSLKHTPRYLQPGESFVIANVYDAAYEDPLERNYGQTKNRPGFVNMDNFIPIHSQETTDVLFPYRPDSEMWGKDSVSRLESGYAVDRLTYICTGTGTGALWYHLDNGDSVIVDQWAVKEDPVYTGNTLKSPSDIAGVYHAKRENHCVRKFSVKEGTWDWDLSAGIDAEDSQWLVLPPWYSWKVPTTVGTHGDYSIDLSSNSIGINLSDTILTVPWGTYLGDSILDELTFGPGMSWQYLEDSLNSEIMRAQEGDILNIYAVGNDLEWMAFEIEVSDPSQDMALVFPKRKLLPPELGDEGPVWGNPPYFVTENDPVMDTILDVPFACRKDSLLKYLEKAPNASWDFEFVDGISRSDLKYGDKLVITAENGTTKKEYFIDAVTDSEYNEQSASHDASLSAITWPDIPGFLEGWEGDTIPLFSATKQSYTVTLPAGTIDIPVLTVFTNDLNATYVAERATLLRGSLAQRTTTFTVTAEDGSSSKEYSVTFALEMPTANKQLYKAEPIWSETASTGLARTYEIANPGDLPLDLSNYMLLNQQSKGPRTPAEAISDLAVNGTYSGRYNGAYVPGFKYTDNEAAYETEQGFLFYDGAVDPVIEPGDVFVLSSFHRSTDIFTSPYCMDLVLPNTDVVNQYSSLWEEGGYWNLNSRGDEDSSPYIWYYKACLMIFQIDNDSILEGRKAIGDPADFTLVDFVGDITKYSRNEVWVGGKPQNQTQYGFPTQEQWKRKPQYVFPHNDLDTTYQQYEWESFSTSDYDDVASQLDVQSEYVTHMDLGSFTFDPITVHLSTVTSVAYLVSDGYKSPQTIQGNLADTKMSEFLGNIFLSNPDQSATLVSGVNGEDLLPGDNVAENDTLIVVSSDGKNTTHYVLLNQPLDDDATLTVKSAYSSMYSIEIESSQGTITGPGVVWGKALKDVISAFTKPVNATLSILDQNGQLVSKSVMNYDTVLVDVILHDSIYLEVVAEDGETKNLYRFAPVAMSNEAFVISSVFVVDQDNRNIAFIPEGISVMKFMENIQAVTGAATTVVDKYRAERSIGILAVDDKLKVVSEDGTKTVYYYLNFFTESMPDNNQAPTLSVNVSNTNVIIGETLSLTATVEDDDMPEPTNLSIIWEVVSGNAGSVTFTSPDQASTDVSFSSVGMVVLQVTVDDGELSASETINVGVSSPDNQAPTIVVAYADTTIAEGTTISVSGTADDDGNPVGSSLSYTWVVKSGEAANVSIASPDQLTSDVTFTASGVYTLQITISDGEAIDSDIIVVVVTSTVGVEYILAPELKMYPNPATQVLTLELMDAGDTGFLVKIVSITGQIVYSSEHMQSKVEIDVNEFAKGVYFVAVRSGDFNTIRRLQIVK